jgi:hypothetical protein
MRIEIDEDLERILDEIRRREWRISGRGHSDTVRFLAQFYQQHRAVEEILDERLRAIPNMIQRCFLDSIRIAVTNLLKAGDEET